MSAVLPACEAESTVKLTCLLGQRASIDNLGCIPMNVTFLHNYKCHQFGSIPERMLARLQARSAVVILVLSQF